MLGAERLSDLAYASRPGLEPVVDGRASPLVACEVARTAPDGRMSPLVACEVARTARPTPDGRAEPTTCCYLATRGPARAPRTSMLSTSTT